MLIQHVNWLQRFAAAIGGWPDNHVAIDTETTGFAKTDQIWELGWACTTQGQLANYGATQIKMSSNVDVDPWAVYRAFDRTKTAMARNGTIWDVDYAWLESNGTHIVPAYRDFYTLLDEAQQAGYWLMGHRILRFDLPRIADAMRAFAGVRTLPWSTESIIDTEAVVVGMQVNMPMPDPGKLELWYEHVKHVGRRDIKSSQAFCAEMFGVPAAPASHRAGEDSVQLSWISQKIRELINGCNRGGGGPGQ